MQVERSGFYPKGGGRCVLTARALAPGACLPLLDLTERGRLVRVDISAFAAGRLGVGVAERMARAAERALHEVGFSVKVSWAQLPAAVSRLGLRGIARHQAVPQLQGITWFSALGGTRKGERALLMTLVYVTWAATPVLRVML